MALPFYYTKYFPTNHSTQTTDLSYGCKRDRIEPTGTRIGSSEEDKIVDISEVVLGLDDVDNVVSKSKANGKRVAPCIEIVAVLLLRAEIGRAHV